MTHAISVPMPQTHGVRPLDPELERRIDLLENADQMPAPLDARDWVLVLITCLIVPVVMLVVAYNI